MAKFEGPKWGSATPGTAAAVTWSFATLDLTSQFQARGLTGYLSFDSAISTQYQSLVRAAADAWEAVANIDLTEVADSASAQIRIGNRYIDGAAVPGQSSTVGETSFWSNGGRMTAAEVYFDTDAYTGTSFYQIAVHEIGHALGLDHSDISSAVMYYMVNSQNRSGQLSNDDVNGIQYLYGAKAIATPSLTVLQAAFTNILRIDPTSADATKTTIVLADRTTVPNPAFTQAQSLSSLANQIDAGVLSLSRALTTIGHFADATTSVASLSYLFFTGKTPTSAGLDFLVHSATNTSDLNDAYYAKFNIENRYINFAVNLGKLGEGQAAFQARYGALSLADAVKLAYTDIFGAAPTDQKVSDILTAPISVGGQTITRADYLASYGGDGPSGLGTKAAAVGFLLVEAVKADIGPYALANDKFLADLSDGVASYNVDIRTVYALVSDPTAAAAQSADLVMHTDGLVQLAGQTSDYATDYVAHLLGIAA